MIKSIAGDITAGFEVANNLFSIIDLLDFINKWELGDLYFLCNEFEKCMEMYNHEKMYPSVNNLALYFYSHFELGLIEKLDNIYNDIIDKKKLEIQEEQDDNDEEWSEEDRKSYVQELSEDIKAFTLLYNSILNKEYKPIVDFSPELIYGCYLINCPRHGN